MNVGSVAKQITARLVLLAAQDGRLRLDQAASKLLPRLNVPDATILDLIRHRTGIRDAESMLSLAAFRDLDHYTSSDLLTLAYRQSGRANPPGTFLYSNTGYLMLAEILRITYGLPLQDIASELIFKPLGMTSAMFKADPRTVIANSAASYSRSATGDWRSESRPVTLEGPGSLWCSVHDLDQWLKHLRADWNAGPTQSLPYAIDVPYVPSDHAPHVYGAGLYATLTTKCAEVFHSGHEHGFSAAVHLTRDGAEVICMSNRADLPADRLVPLIRNRVGRLADVGLDSLVDDVIRTGIQSSGSPVAEVKEAACTAENPPDVWGDYVSDDVPGVIRLIRSGLGLCLQRRGSADVLTRADHADGPVYTGPGYRIRDLGSTSESLPATFILDLHRAPGLVYIRRE
jgi:hypothetical protein